MILDLIDKNKDITQREMSYSIGVAVSMINNYLNDYEKKGLIKRKKHSTKTVEYFVTKKGVDRKKVLNISYLNDSLKVFKLASEDILSYLYLIWKKGFKRIFLYGAGEVAEILLQTLALDTVLSLSIVGVIDDDKTKQSETMVGTRVLHIDNIDLLEHDGILISSYSNKDLIMNKLLSRNYDKNKILNFFDF